MVIIGIFAVVAFFIVLSSSSVRTIATDFVRKTFEKSIGFLICLGFIGVFVAGCVAGMFIGSKLELWTGASVAILTWFFGTALVIGVYGLITVFLNMNTNLQKLVEISSEKK